MRVPRFLPDISEALYLKKKKKASLKAGLGKAIKSKAAKSSAISSFQSINPFTIETFNSLLFPRPLARNCLLPSSCTHIASYIPPWVLPAQSKTNQAEPYNLLHQTGITPTHLKKKNLASFQGNGSKALAGLSQRG